MVKIFMYLAMLVSFMLVSANTNALQKKDSLIDKTLENAKLRAQIRLNALMVNIKWDHKRAHPTINSTSGSLALPNSSTTTLTTESPITEEEDTSSSSSSSTSSSSTSSSSSPRTSSGSLSLSSSSSSSPTSTSSSPSNIPSALDTITKTSTTLTRTKTSTFTMTKTSTTLTKTKTSTTSTTIGSTTVTTLTATTISLTTIITTATTESVLIPLIEDLTTESKTTTREKTKETFTTMSSMTSSSSSTLNRRARKSHINFHENGLVDDDENLAGLQFKVGRGGPVDEDKRDDKPTIVAGVLSAVVSVALISFIVLVVAYHKKENRTAPGFNGDGPGDTNSGTRISLWEDGVNEDNDGDLNIVSALSEHSKQDMQSSASSDPVFPSLDMIDLPEDLGDGGLLFGENNIFDELGAELAAVDHINNDDDYPMITSPSDSITTATSYSSLSTNDMPDSFGSEPDILSMLDMNNSKPMMQVHTFDRRQVPPILSTADELEREFWKQEPVLEQDVHIPFMAPTQQHNQFVWDKANQLPIAPPPQAIPKPILQAKLEPPTVARIEFAAYINEPGVKKADRIEHLSYNRMFIAVDNSGSRRRPLLQFKLGNDISQVKKVTFALHIPGYENPDNSETYIVMLGRKNSSHPWGEGPSERTKFAWGGVGYQKIEDFNFKNWYKGRAQREHKFQLQCRDSNGVLQFVLAESGVFPVYQKSSKHWQPDSAEPFGIMRDSKRTHPGYELQLKAYIEQQAKSQSPTPQPTRLPSNPDIRFPQLKEHVKPRKSPSLRVTTSTKRFAADVKLSSKRVAESTLDIDYPGVKRILTNDYRTSFNDSTPDEDDLGARSDSYTSSISSSSTSTSPLSYGTPPFHSNTGGLYTNTGRHVNSESLC
eukprot:m.334319 g.334319  ORF g.334319 m.334319 type:complete len:882 (+) comp17333_c0_seq1:227-2872(+)